MWLRRKQSENFNLYETHSYFQKEGKAAWDSRSGIWELLIHWPALLLTAWMTLDKLFHPSECVFSSVKQKLRYWHLLWGRIVPSLGFSSSQQLHEDGRWDQSDPLLVSEVQSTRLSGQVSGTGKTKILSSDDRFGWFLLHHFIPKMREPNFKVPFQFKIKWF